MNTINKILILIVLNNIVNAQTLKSGEKILLQCTFNSGGNTHYYTYPILGGNMDKDAKLKENAKFSQIFILQKVFGDGEIKDNDLVFLKSPNGLYLSCKDGTGNVVMQKKINYDPLFSDEILKINFLKLNEFNKNKIKVKLSTRAKYDLGINNIPCAIIYNFGKENEDVLVAAKADQFNLIKITNTSFEDVSSQIYSVFEFKARDLGWEKDKYIPLNGGHVLKTKGGKGYVQYYTFENRKTAIYHFPGKGTFAMNTSEMEAYDAAGQDNFAFVISDPKNCGIGCGYNDIIQVGENTEGIIMWDKLVYGSIYQKYKELNRWTGPLGHPITSEVPGVNNLPEKGRFSFFENGLIVYTGFTGANAIWGKVQKLWENTDNERGWLGFPLESNNIKSIFQEVKFQNGTITLENDCQTYKRGSKYVDIKGSSNLGKNRKICY
jgi:hypothetical protein